MSRSANYCPEISYFSNIVSSRPSLGYEQWQDHRHSLTISGQVPEAQHLDVKLRKQDGYKFLQIVDSQFCNKKTRHEPRRRTVTVLSPTLQCFVLFLFGPGHFRPQHRAIIHAVVVRLFHSKVLKTSLVLKADGACIIDKASIRRIIRVGLFHIEFQLHGNYS